MFLTSLLKNVLRFCWINAARPTSKGKAAFCGICPPPEPPEEEEEEEEEEKENTQG